jgi:hypothetical protein
MAQQQASIRILAGAFSFMGLGLAWIAIVASLPSLQELSAKELPQPRPVSAVTAKPPPEPMLDLSIPGVPVAPPVPSDQNPPAATVKTPSVVAPLDPRAAQVARLRCDVEVEQLCSDSLAGPARKQCLEKRAQQLPMSCQQQLRERFVKWKEEGSRLTTACQTDMKRFCSAARLGRFQKERSSSNSEGFSSTSFSKVQYKRSLTRPPPRSHRRPSMAVVQTRPSHLPRVSCFPERG